MKTGGTITFSIFKPSYSHSQFKPCIESSTHIESSNELFVTQITVTTSITPTFNPTFAPTPRVEGLENVFYAIGVYIVACMIYGIYVVRIRKTVVPDILELEIYRAAIQFSFFAASTISELSYLIAIYFNRHRLYFIQDCGLCIIVARLGHLPFASYLAYKLIFEKKREGMKSYYVELINVEFLLKNLSTYIMLFLFIFYDNTKLPYLPWITSRCCEITKGYPTMITYRLSILISFLQLSISFLIQIIALGLIRVHLQYEDLTYYTKTSLCLYFVFTILSLIFLVIGYLLQRKVIEKASENERDSTLSITDNPMANDIFRIASAPSTYFRSSDSLKRIGRESDRQSANRQTDRETSYRSHVASVVEVKENTR